MTWPMAQFRVPECVVDAVRLETARRPGWKEAQVWREALLLGLKQMGLEVDKPVAKRPTRRKR